LYFLFVEAYLQGSRFGFSAASLRLLCGFSAVPKKDWSDKNPHKTYPSTVSSLIQRAENDISRSGKSTGQPHERHTAVYIILRK
jgi:hypothetical protein